MQHTTMSSDVESDLRSAMERMAYTPVAASAAVSWLEHRNTLRGCPVIEPADLEPLTEVVAQCLQRQADREAALQVNGWLEQPAESWPTWCDGHIFNPTDDDRREAASTAAAVFEGTIRRNILESRSLEASTVALHELGLAAPDAPRTARSRIVADWTDADQRRHHCGFLAY